MEISEKNWISSQKSLLISEPWHSLDHLKDVDSKSHLFAKYVFNSEGYEILFTDLHNIWNETINSESILSRFNEINRNIEAPIQKIISQIKDCLNNSCHDHSEVSIIDNIIQLHFDTKLAGLPFSWKFYGQKSTSSSDMHEHLLSPLLLMVHEMQRQVQVLYKLLSDKDKQIADYRMQGGQVSRKHLETPLFDVNSHEKKMAECQEFSGIVLTKGLDSFNSSNQKLYKQIMLKQRWINKPPSETMAGESLLDEMTLPITTTSVTSWNDRLPPSVMQSPARNASLPSPNTSPIKSPIKNDIEIDVNSELLRRQELEKRLLEEEISKTNKVKKKKLKF